MYENKVGLYLFNVFFLSVFYLSWNIAGQQISCLCAFFQLTAARIARD